METTVWHEAYKLKHSFTDKYEMQNKKPKVKYSVSDK